ncbi:MAG: VCBS domain-containing protein [Burkholderiaceae bacterium]
MSTTVVVDTSTSGTTLTGTDSRDILIGRSGDDTLDGGAGSDSLKAGSGNDVLIYDEIDWNIDGGSGYDTLRFMGTDQTLDLRNYKVVSNIEQLQLWGGGGHYVYLDASSIKTLSDNDAMLIKGDSSNTVDIGSGWTFAGLTDDGLFQKFTNNGATIQSELAVNIAGYSGNAVISSPINPDLTEDSDSPVLRRTGTLTVTDPNAGQEYLLSTINSATGNLGYLSLTNPGPYAGTATGAYVYLVANDDVQYLGANQSKEDSFTLHSLDGSTETISFIIHGINDDAIITVDPDAAHYQVTEDSTEEIDVNGNLVATGSLTITDADQGEALFKAETLPGIASTLIVTQNGQFTYLVDNNMVQSMKGSESRHETFQVKSVDATSVDLTFTIQGVNDAAIITDDPIPAHYQVTEDSNVNANNLVASGTLTISDVDQGENHTMAVTTAGTYGTFIIDQDGRFTYTASNLNPIIQGLNNGDFRTDSFDITTIDGTVKNLTFTIHGADEPVSLTVGAGGFHANVTELINLYHASPDNDPDFTHIRSGKFAIIDSDPNATFAAVTVAAGPANTPNMGSLVASVVDAPGGGKMVQWTFQVSDSQLDSLLPSELNGSKVQNFTLTMTDNHGTTTSTNVSISLFGTAEYLFIPRTGSGSITGSTTNDRAFGSAGTDIYTLGSGNDIAIGEGRDLFYAQSGEKLVSFGGNADDNIFSSEAGAVMHIGFGGAGRDFMDMENGTSEMHGNAGDDHLNFIGGDKSYAWGGQGSDLFTLYTGSNAENWLMDFDSRSIASGGDLISAYGNRNNWHLVEHTTDADNPFLAEGETYYDLIESVSNVEKTVLKIVGQNLDLDTLIANGNLAFPSI